ncbi:MBL fold metallo-hydrolase [bacterium]|nr:MBL fold metallo-hydrolase [bacterium]
MRFGNFEVDILTEGNFRLDGGAMFGVVPRLLWEKRMPPDEKNRITLGLRQLLVRGKGFNLIIDTGIGTKGDEKFLSIYSVNIQRSWEDRLSPFGLSPSDVSHVILTHLHFDHAGGATRFNEDRTEVVSSFPNAKFYVQIGEWREACAPFERSKSSYFFENYLPLQNFQGVSFLSGDSEILPGIFSQVTGGHTKHHQIVSIIQGEVSIHFLGDLIPTSNHLPLAWNMAYDLFPVELLEARRSLLAHLLASKDMVVFEHDFEGGFKRVIGSIQKPQLLEVNP